jgi:hypothetical protein
MILNQHHSATWTDNLLTPGFQWVLVGITNLSGMGGLEWVNDYMVLVAIPAILVWKPGRQIKNL